MLVKLTQNEIVGIFVEKMKKHKDAKINTYIYDKADPTFGGKVEVSIWLMYGYTIPKEMGSYPPNPEIVKVNILNSTWGFEFKFKTSNGTEEGYFDYRNQEWRLVTENFFQVFNDLLINGEDHDFDTYVDFELM